MALRGAATVMPEAAEASAAAAIVTPIQPVVPIRSSIDASGHRASWRCPQGVTNERRQLTK